MDKTNGKMDTRVGCGAVSVLADIVEDVIRVFVDAEGRYIGDPDLIRKYLDLKSYLDNFE